MDRFTWDDHKRRKNLESHGLDLAGVYEFLWDTADIRATYPSKTGRPRWKATGWLQSQMVTIVFSPLGSEAYSVISMRPASRKERIAYEKR